jgi:Rab3 GTPase-activating protein catalytic subunit
MFGNPQKPFQLVGKNVYSKEAEKVLHFLESQTLGSIGQLTIPSLFHSALMKLQKEATDIQNIIPNFEAMQQKIKQNCCSLSREKWISSVSKKKWENIVNEISEMEWCINQAKSIMMKLEIENSITKHEVFV